MTLSRKAMGWTVAFLLGGASSVFAQGLPLWKDSESSLWFRLEERLRWEVREDADFRKAVEDRNDFLGQRLRLGFDLRLGDSVSVFAEGQDSRHFGADADAARIRGRYTDLRQAYLEIRNVGGLEGLSVKLGRQELVYGQERLVGAFGWSNVGRTFDAAKVRWASASASVDLFLARARRRPLLPDTPEQYLSGLYASFFTHRQDLRLETYALWKKDWTPLAGERGGRSDSRAPTYGGRFLWAPGAGVQMAAEAAWQRGHRGPDPHRADAQSLRLSWSPPSGAPLTLGVEWNRASGDENPFDGRSGSFDNLFPTNHDKYGLMDYQNWSNLRSLSLFGVLKALSWAEVRGEVHRFRLESARAPWTSAGGAVLGWDPTGASGRNTGWEWDLALQGRLPAAKGFRWLTGLSEYHPGAFARAVRGGDPSRYFYLQVGHSF